MEQSKAQAQSTSSANLFGDFSKLMEQFKLPGIDVAALMEARRKDLEALAAANRTAFEGMQSLGQKQTEMLRSTLDELQALVKQVKGSGDSGSTSLSDAMQRVLQKTFANMRELAETAHKSQTDAFAIVSQRIQENVQEAKNLLKQTR
jgi:phasin family protein